MNLHEIYELIEQIAETSKTNDKLALLKEGCKDSNFKYVLEAGLNPFVTYGVGETTYPDRTTQSSISDRKYYFLDISELLMSLSDRTLSGNDAISAILQKANSLPLAEETLLRRIILKDFRAGFGISLVNKACKGLIPRFECKKAAKFDPDKIKKYPVYVQEKLDGVRALIVVKNGTATAKSREGHPLPGLEHIEKELEAKMHPDSDFVLDGEYIKGDFNSTVSSARTKSDGKGVLHIFDLIRTEAFMGKDVWKLNYNERCEAMENFVVNGSLQFVEILPRYHANSYAEIMQMTDKVWDQGGEGVIVKTAVHLYKHTRNYDWMKVKKAQTLDLKVVGKFEGTGKYKGKLGGLTVDFNGNTVNVGGGFSDEEREKFWHSEMDDKVIEVEFHEITKPTKGQLPSLRHPRFKRIRFDKTPDASGYVDAGV